MPLVTIYSTNRVYHAPQFPHTLVTYRNDSDPRFAEHLQEQVRRYCGVPPYLNLRSYLFRHLRLTRHQTTFDVDDDHLDAIPAWAATTNGIILANDRLMREEGCQPLIMTYRGRNNRLAQILVPKDARQRRERNDATILALGLQPFKYLLEVAAESEVRPRKAQSIAKRCLALFVLAQTAQNVIDGITDTKPLAARWPIGVKALSREESDCLRQSFTVHDAKELTQRFEAVNLLLWALGHAKLPPANQRCDKDHIKDLLASDQQLFVDNAGLRPIPQLLDALDMHTRLHWISDNQQRREQSSPHLIHTVIAERYNALVWLTGTSV